MHVVTWSHGCPSAVDQGMSDSPATSPPKRWRCAMSSTQEVSEWPEGTGPLRHLSLCLARIVEFIVILMLVGLLASLFVGAKLDCWLTPHRTWPEWNCDDVPFLDSMNNQGDSYIEARMSYLLHNNITLQNAPRSCQLIHATDVVSSTSKAQQCAAWCEEQHLDRSVALLLPEINTDNETVMHGMKLFTACFKAEMSVVVGTYIPNKWWFNKWLAGLLYRLVGLMPAAVLLWRSKPDDGAGDETQSTNPPDRHRPCRDDGPFPDGDLGFPWNITVGCCWRPTTDFIASRFHLAKSAFTVVTEPLFDAVSVFTFLKNGQPFYLVFMMYGLSLGFLMSRDGLQSAGALALVRSWRRGFATKTLLKHRYHDLPECFISTWIQLYAALSSSWSQDPCNVLQFGMFAWMSILLTLPEATSAMILLPKFGQQGVNADDFYEVENAKKQIGIRKYILSVSVVAFTQTNKNLWGGNVGYCTWAWFGELALVLLAWQTRWPQKWSRAGAFGLARIFFVWCIFGSSITAGLPTHLHHFLTHLELIREIPWTWPLLWPHWPWLVPEIRWDILAAAMQTFNHMAGVLSASMSYRRVVRGIKSKPYDPRGLVIQGIVYSVKDKSPSNIFKPFTLLNHSSRGFISICAVALGILACKPIAGPSPKAQRGDFMSQATLELIDPRMAKRLNDFQV